MVAAVTISCPRFPLGRDTAPSAKQVSGPSSSKLGSPLFQSKPSVRPAVLSRADNEDMIL